MFAYFSELIGTPDTPKRIELRASKKPGDHLDIRVSLVDFRILEKKPFNQEFNAGNRRRHSISPLFTSRGVGALSWLN